MTVKTELEALLQDGAGFIKPGAIVDWAREHPESRLYKQFEWDDATAAEEYRKHQARRLVAIYLVDDLAERRVISLSIDRVAGGPGYRDVRDVWSADDLRQQALRDALAELRRVEERFRHLRELATLWAHRAEVEAAVLGTTAEAA